MIHINRKPNLIIESCKSTNINSIYQKLSIISIYYRNTYFVVQLNFPAQFWFRGNFFYSHFIKLNNKTFTYFNYNSIEFMRVEYDAY